MAVMALASPAPPTWPTRYYTAGTFSIPYGTIVMPLENNYDGDSQRQVLRYNNGLDSTYSFMNQGALEYEVVPHVSEFTCRVLKGQASLVNMLPDLNGWTYIGSERHMGWIAQHWQWVESNFSRTSVSDFWFAVDNSTARPYPRPLELRMQGIDWLYGSHPDTYVLMYNGYVPDWNAPAAFDLPPLCDSASAVVVDELDARTALSHARASLLHRMAHPAAARTPASALEREFHGHMATYGKTYASPEEYAMRLVTYAKNRRMIDAHNVRHARGEVTYRLGMNHFGDMTDEEFARLMLPMSLRKPANGRSDHVVHDAEADVSGLPASFDWRSYGAVGPVRDQGICGSCWTFGTAGSVSGFAAVRSQGNFKMLSTQQILDCVWLKGNPSTSADSGCDGGFASSAMEWIAMNNGLALESDYLYQMTDGFCDDTIHSSGIQLTGYVNVTSGSEPALQVAVSLGPVAIAIDAAAPGFAFYESGVWSSTQCKNDLLSLDHEVLAIGWGSENGQDYWLVQNSWSPHWGENGYVKMARNDNNMCGIASQANYPILA